MFIVLTYDIADDRRRTRLHKALKRFGTPVQYSVFEFHLNPAQWQRLRIFVRREINPQLDQVRYYFLCETCQQRIDTTPCSHRTGDPFALVV